MLLMFLLPLITAAPSADTCTNVLSQSHQSLRVLVHYVCHSPAMLAVVKLVISAGGGYARPEALYFWFYFIIVNSIWIIVPALVMWYSAGHINRRVAHTSSLKKFQ